MKSYVESGDTTPVSCADVWLKWVIAHAGCDGITCKPFFFPLHDLSETALCAKWFRLSCNTFFNIMYLMRSLSKQHSHSLLLNMYRLKLRCWHDVAVGVQWRMFCDLILNCISFESPHISSSVSCLGTIAPKEDACVCKPAFSSFIYIYIFLQWFTLNNFKFQYWMTISCLVPTPHCACAVLASQQCLRGIAKCQLLFKTLKTATSNLVPLKSSRETTHGLHYKIAGS